VTGKNRDRLTWTSFRGRRSRLPGEKQKKVADQETLVLLQRFSGNPGVEKARAEFERAQEVEERFLHDFDGVDFTMR
jgi:hypothetical protein